MNSLVKLSFASRQINLIRAQLHAGVGQRSTQSNLGLEYVGGKIIQVGGKEAGEELENGLIKANQKVLVDLGTVRPAKYHSIIVVHPEIIRAGVVGVAGIAEPDEEALLGFTFRADHQIDLRALPYLLRLYLLD